MKNYNIKYANIYVAPNFANLEYSNCAMSGMTKDEIRGKFYDAYKNGEMIITIEEIGE